MRRNETRKISDILGDFTQQGNMDQKLKENTIINYWPEMLGPVIASSTRKIFISNRILYVYIDSSVIRHELFMMRTQIMEKLNKRVNDLMLDNIVFK